jgi:CrcB protein
MLKMFLITGAGGFLGSGLRYLSQRLISYYFPISFPYGTLFINIAGSFLIGLIFALSDKSNILSPELRIFLAVGFCGGFTTFSSFALDSYGLLKDSEYLYFTAYLVSSTVIGIMALIAGIWFIKSL